MDSFIHQLWMDDGQFPLYNKSESESQGSLGEPNRIRELSGSEPLFAGMNYMGGIDMSQKTKRILMAFFGVVITGFCVGTFQKASLGADPFTCFVTAFANVFHSTYSTFYLIITGALLVGVFFINRHYIGIATIFNLLGTGIAADFMYNLLDHFFPDPSLAGRFAMLAIGVLVTCFSASLYFTADLGVSAYDAVALTAANKYKLAAFRVCRISTDLVCVIAGFFCHVTIGVGTVITALLMGPIIQWYNTHVSEPLLYATDAEIYRRRQEKSRARGMMNA